MIKTRPVVWLKNDNLLLTAVSLLAAERHILYSIGQMVGWAKVGFSRTLLRLSKKI
jgi:hypothetical protein